MSVETEEFTRKTFDVKAIRVTHENLNEIAEWCKGFLKNGNINKDAAPIMCVKVPVRKAATVRQTLAFPGDWVLVMKDYEDKDSFKVYHDKAFKAGFENKKQDQLF